MTGNRYRTEADHFRRWFIGYTILTIIAIIAFVACLMFRSAALSIAFACVSVLFAFIACTLRNDYVIFRDLADYQDDIESNEHDTP